jgi:hypothetical protein
MSTKHISNCGAVVGSKLCPYTNASSPIVGDVKVVVSKLNSEGGHSPISREMSNPLQ